MKTLSYTLLLLVLIFACAAPTSAAKTSEKPRLIATTDGEIDDRCSMIRFLLYANEWDIKGIIHSSSKFHWKGDDTHEGKGWKPVEWLDRQLDAYAEVYPNLKKHDATYPAPDYLRSVVYVGNIAYVGDMRKPSPGSDRIVEVLLEEDDSPVWLQAWGGSNTIARALKTIQDEHPERVEEVTKKARLFLIARQDKTLKEYITPEWPDLQVLLSDWPSFEAIAYGWKKILPKDVGVFFDKDWMGANILQGHGPLCAMYEHKDGRFRSEGDTPSYLHTINTGLRSQDHTSYGGWGGRFKHVTRGLWISVDERGISLHSIARWAKDFQNDWAAHADWCVMGYDEANHPPRVALAHAYELTAKSGQKISLDTSSSTDPDGNTLSFEWWHYQEAGNYHAPVAIENGKSPEATIVIPDDASPGDEIHMICSVTDAGDPPLTRYARVIVTITK